MKKRIIIFFVLIIVLGFLFQSMAQFTPEDVAERAKWEEFLKTAEIVGSQDIGEGVTKPIRLFLKKGDVEGSGAWKNPRGMQKGFLEGWQYEIAAYEMDKLLNMNMIPPTVEKKFKGKRGSLQLWMEDCVSYLKIMQQNIPMPPEQSDHYSNMKYVTRAFDSLIGNEDRTQIF